MSTIPKAPIPSPIPSPDVEPQNVRALRRANKIMRGRAALKRKIAAGDVSLAEILAPGSEIPDVLRSMPILKALMAQHRWGQRRARRLLVVTGIGELRRLDALTDRERGVLATRLREGRGPDISAAA